MNFQNTSQPYMRPVIQIGVGQHSLRRRKSSFPVSITFWRPVGKVLFLLIPLMLAINLGVASLASNTNESIIALENKRHELMDKNIELRAKKARLRGQEQFQQLAAEKLSLYVHKKGQVGVFSKRKGYFVYL
ncbi:MAG: hypothetical protein KAI39_01480 [Desulfobulbaceae bacterium]|nr:hypothetical protein [Desulfobulbaceae bacterium]